MTPEEFFVFPVEVDALRGPSFPFFSFEDKLTADASDRGVGEVGHEFLDGVLFKFLPGIGEDDDVIFRGGVAPGRINQRVEGGHFSLALGVADDVHARITDVREDFFGLIGRTIRADPKVYFLLRIVQGKQIPHFALDDILLVPDGKDYRHARLIGAFLDRLGREARHHRQQQRVGEVAVDY